MLDPHAFAGNWRRFDSFIWYEQPEDAELWGIYHTHHRDSGLLEQSNAAALRTALSRFDQTLVMFERFTHWAVGWIDAAVVRVFHPGSGKPSEAFEVLAKLVEQMGDYPILDESDYSEREYAATLENIRFIGEICCKVSPGLPEDWPSQVYRWLDENDPASLENTDDQGGAWDERKVGRAFRALGYLAHQPGAANA